jgi:hypothetical protein
MRNDKECLVGNPDEKGHFEDLNADDGQYQKDVKERNERALNSHVLF